MTGRTAGSHRPAREATRFHAAKEQPLRHEENRHNRPPPGTRCGTKPAPSSARTGTLPNDPLRPPDAYRTTACCHAPKAQHCPQNPQDRKTHPFPALRVTRADTTPQNRKRTSISANPSGKPDSVANANERLNCLSDRAEMWTEKGTILSILIKVNLV